MIPVDAMHDRDRRPDARDPDAQPATLAAALGAAEHHWRLIGASRRGTSHESSGADREDAFRLHLRITAGQPAWFCIAVADGVGTARFARVGSNLAVETVVAQMAILMTAPAPEELRRMLSIAAWEAKKAIQVEAIRRGAPERDLGTTLLLALGVEWSPGTVDLGLFQVGNGLIACAADDTPLRPLIDPGDETEDGSIYDLTGQHVRETWGDSRFTRVRLDPAPWAVVLMTDGITDDLTPLEAKAPELLAALRRLPADDTAAAALLEEISYVKRGSGDDRTLVCALLAPGPSLPRHDEAPAAGGEPLPTDAEVP